MKLLMGVADVFDRTIELLAIIAAILIVLTMLGITVQVVMRYFLERPIFWIIEVSEYSLLFITFLGVAWLLRREGHVKMDIVLNRLKLRTQALVNIITSIIGAIVFLTVAWYGGQVTWKLFQLGYFIPTLLEPPKWPIVGIIPVGSFLFSIQFIRRAYGYLKSWRAFVT